MLGQHINSGLTLTRRQSLATSMRREGHEVTLFKYVTGKLSGRKKALSVRNIYKPVNGNGAGAQ